MAQKSKELLRSQSIITTKTERPSSILRYHQTFLALRRRREKPEQDSISFTVSTTLQQM